MTIVSIIIVNYNGQQYLKRCLQSLIKTSFKSKEIILVDNGSIDDSVKEAKKIYPEIQIIRLAKNEGFAKGNNEGVKKAKGKYVLLLNNDTEVTKGFLEPMVKELDDDCTIGAIQNKVLLLGNRKRHDSVGAFLTHTGFLFHYGYYQLDKEKYNKKIQLYTAKGACMMVRRSIIDTIGLFDEDFFAYFEETDFCHRLLLFGYKIIYLPQSVIYHKMGATSNMMNSGYIQFHSYKNRICSYLKNLSFRYILVFIPVHITFCFIVGIGYLISGRFVLTFSVLKAILWNIIHLSSTFSKRNIIQRKYRRIQDNQFLPHLIVNPSPLYYLSLFLYGLQGYDEKDTI